MENKKTTILVADDEADILEIYAASLAAKGFEVLQAKNGKEVFEWLGRKGSEINLILLDIVMPVMDGFEVLEKISKDENYKKIPIIVSSNLDSDTDRREAFALGAKEYFEKVKWDPGKVASKIIEIIGKK